MHNVKYISLYIKCDGFAYPYRVFYKYNEQNVCYNNTFENIDSANHFLKELYEKVEPGFLHYNYTMPEYNAKSKDAYFFNRGNDSIKNAYEYDGLAKPVYNLRPLKKAYRELFGSRLKLPSEHNNQQVKNNALLIGVMFILVSSLGILSYEFYKQQKMLKDADAKLKQMQEYEKYLENKIRELEASKTINMMDTIKQNKR